jgi:hypothetical protein
VYHAAGVVVSGVVGETYNQGTTTSTVSSFGISLSLIAASDVQFCGGENQYTGGASSLAFSTGTATTVYQGSTEFDIAYATGGASGSQTCTLSAGGTNAVWNMVYADYSGSAAPTNTFPSMGQVGFYDIARAVVFVADAPRDMICGMDDRAQLTCYARGTAHDS